MNHLATHRAGTAETERETLISADENQRMFDAIAHRYDLMNRLISLGLDHGWRRRALDQLEPKPGGRYLDVGTGTGDLVCAILDRCPGAQVVGLDPAGAMLAYARRKAHHHVSSGRASFVRGDGLCLPGRDNSCDGIISAFCLRNMERREAALAETHRLLCPGSRAVIVELTTPRSRPLAWLHGLFGRTYVPVIAYLLSQGDAYRYLLKSVAAFPAPERIVTMMEGLGYNAPQAIPLSGGIVTLFVGTKV
jgi:demethylmenaquinone methyltransferase/2-methoxy-6-polyprenyl-1,4-benzoquinol methylase